MTLPEFASGSSSIVADVLNRRFELSQLYPMQQRILDRLLDGGHALVVLPTGSGKSLCYQLPALLPGVGAIPDSGVTLIFSPLIALMEDQVSQLKPRGIRAEYINSTLGRAERERRYQALGDGEYELIYATPERMLKPEFVAALDRLPGGVRLLAIDEAHCITKWGHDFRPAYQRVGEFRRVLGNPLTIALTATATPVVRADIQQTLGLDAVTMPLFAQGLDRPNLSFEVVECWHEKDKLEAIREVAASMPGTGIVYFSLIRTLEELAHEIGRDGVVDVEVYHGRLNAAEKKRVYRRFAAARPEEHLLLLATPAFGMGVDKPDIRFVMHAEVPGSVEAYYQEVGRAGRDGQPSRCVLLYEEADLAIQQRFVDWMNPGPEILEAALAEFRQHPLVEFDADALRERVVGRNRGDRRVEYCLITLEKWGAIEAAGAPEHYRFVRNLAADVLDPVEIADKTERDLRRLLDMVHLAKSDDVRNHVLEYFALDESSPGGNPREDSE